MPMFKMNHKKKQSHLSRPSRSQKSRFMVPKWTQIKSWELMSKVEERGERKIHSQLIFDYEIKNQLSLRNK